MAWAKANPEKRRATAVAYRDKAREAGTLSAMNRRWDLQKSYGLTVAQYDTLLEQQAGACAICWKVPSGKLNVDHDHETGNVRALLCTACNHMLGKAYDNPAILRCAADYLEEHNSSRADVNMPEEIATAA